MKKARFASRTEFTKTLTAAVESYFSHSKITPFANASMILKTVTVLALFLVTYLALLLGNFTTLVTIILAFLFAQTLVMIGFSIMHDSNHGSYSSNATINRILGFSLDFVGGSSLLWCQKHNFLHHSYTNINGLDDDIQTAGFIRLSPNQPWKPHYRFQAIYAPILYSMLTMYWFLFNDFVQFFSKKIGPYKVRAIGGKETALFLLFKVVYIGYMVVLPLQFHSWPEVLAVFVFVNLIAGFTISVIFQLAHTLECNSFPEPDSKGNISEEFMIHQLKTTANFSPNNPFLTWYLGGLNYQIEHHLFPKICHIHYPQISRIVETVCHDFDVPYKKGSFFGRAIWDHFRFLHLMGKKI